MKCERCGRGEGEYLCSVCNRVVCERCKIMDKGKVYCLDHAPKRLVPTQTIQTPGQIPQPVKPKSSRLLKELIVADLIMLIGVIIIYYISNFYIAGLLTSMAEDFSDMFPGLDFLFTLLTYFETSGLYLIITLFIILVISLAVLRLKKQRYKNI